MKKYTIEKDGFPLSNIRVLVWNCNIAGSERIASYHADKELFYDETSSEESYIDIIFTHYIYLDEITWKL